MDIGGAVLPGCLVAALVAGGGLIAGAAVAQHPTTSREPIVIHSVFSNINDETSTADFTDIIVSQGDTRLTAERARAKGVGFTDSQWTFAGLGTVVRMKSPMMRSRTSSAFPATLSYPMGRACRSVRRCLSTMSGTIGCKATHRASGELYTSPSHLSGRSRRITQAPPGAAPRRRPPPQPPEIQQPFSG